MAANYLSYRLPSIVIITFAVVCVQLAHSSLGDWKAISIAHVIIIIKSEVSTLPIVIFFPWLSAWDICYIMFCHSLHIHSGKTGIQFFIMIAQFMMSANNRTRFGLQIVLVYLYIAPSHYHHRTNLSEDIKFIKCISDIFCRVREWD